MLILDQQNAMRSGMDSHGDILLVDPGSSAVIPEPNQPVPQQQGGGGGGSPGVVPAFSSSWFLSQGMYNGRTWYGFSSADRWLPGSGSYGLCEIDENGNAEFSIRTSSNFVGIYPDMILMNTGSTLTTSLRAYVPGVSSAPSDRSAVNITISPSCYGSGLVRMDGTNLFVSSNKTGTSADYIIYDLSPVLSGVSSCNIQGAIVGPNAVGASTYGGDCVRSASALFSSGAYDNTRYEGHVSGSHRLYASGTNDTASVLSLSSSGASISPVPMVRADFYNHSTYAFKSYAGENYMIFNGSRTNGLSGNMALVYNAVRLFPSGLSGLSYEFNYYLDESNKDIGLSRLPASQIISTSPLVWSDAQFIGYAGVADNTAFVTRESYEPFASKASRLSLGRSTRIDGGRIAGAYVNVNTPASYGAVGVVVSPKIDPSYTITGSSYTYSYAAAPPVRVDAVLCLRLSDFPPRSSSQSPYVNTASLIASDSEYMAIGINVYDVESHPAGPLSTSTSTSTHVVAFYRKDQMAAAPSNSETIIYPEFSTHSPRAGGGGPSVTTFRRQFRS